MSSSVRDTFISVAIFSARDADLEGIGKFVLQPQRRDQRTEIGVAAALAEPVQRALDLPRAGAHRGQRIGDRLLGIVMGVDADMAAGDVLDDTSPTMVSTSCGMVPPLVSHSTTQRAPDSYAALAQASANSAFSL